MGADYESRAAADAQRAGYGGRSYWDYLEAHAKELRDKFLARGDRASAERMMSRTLSESLAGNNGD
jgi:hypothetical protein